MTGAVERRQWVRALATGQHQVALVFVPRRNGKALRSAEVRRLYARHIVVARQRLARHVESTCEKTG